MNFEQLNKEIQQRFTLMAATGKLFKSSVTGQQVWDTYLASFEPGDDPVFRDPDSSSHNGNNDKNFIRRYGNIVAIDELLNIVTMFDVVVGKQYQPSMDAMSKLLREAKIADVFFETFDSLNSMNYEKTNKTQTSYQLGTASNLKTYTLEEVNKFGVVELGKVYKFNHFHVHLPSLFVDKSGASVESIQGQYRDAKNVFLRGMEIPVDTLELIKDLITQGSLLNGEAHLFKINEFIPLAKLYATVPQGKKDTWAWLASYKLSFAKFRNELIGTLAVELAEGEDLNKAVMNWNKRVDPANYMKAVAPITQSQIKQAQTFVEENGYEASFDRRFATIDDISVDEILHSNVGTQNLKTASVFDKVSKTTATSTRHKRSQFDGIEEVSIEKFMKDILPTVTSVEALLENRFQHNMVTLTTANQKDSKPIFKWNNNYSWTYNGNLTGKSEIKEQVKQAGGKVDGVLRFSITWNENGKDFLDFDAHAKEPDGNEISYMRNRYPSLSKMSGSLDVDMIRPHKIGVENITWANRAKMMDGNYQMIIHNYDGGRNTGFKAEIEFDGEVYNYEYKGNAQGRIVVATVNLKNGVFTIQHAMTVSEGSSSANIWGLETNQFHKVSLISLSPNHWGDNNIGNKHYFMMLEGAHSDTQMRSFHVENLSDELLKHRKVMEVLANTTKLEVSDKQLAGLGFNATVKDDVILRLTGSHKRTVKVKF